MLNFIRQVYTKGIPHFLLHEEIKIQQLKITFSMSFEETLEVQTP